ncbi:hypothetical protein AVEN_204304-1, partial [Araneus ventricosus]
RKHLEPAGVRHTVPGPQGGLFAIQRLAQREVLDYAQQFQDGHHGHGRRETGEGVPQGH